MRANGKPPLARSPIRLRPRRAALQPTAINTTHITPPGLLTKSQLSDGSWEVEKPELQPEFNTISWELRALAKMVHQEFRTGDESMFDGNVSHAQKSPLFERGRFYDEYSARRNERLNKKKGELEGYKMKTGYDLGVRVDTTKKRETRKFESERNIQTPRYSLRSCAGKENKKIQVPMINVEKPVEVTERKIGPRRVRKA